MNAARFSVGNIALQENDQEPDTKGIPRIGSSAGGRIAMDTYHEIATGPRDSARRIGSIAVFVCSAFGAVAVGSYVLDIYRQTGVITAQHLALEGILVLWILAAAVAWRNRRNRLACRLEASAIIGLLPLLSWHIWRTYWATAYGPRPLPGFYRWSLILGLALATTLMIASLAHRIAARRTALRITALTIGLIGVVVVVEGALSLIAPPFPRSCKYATRGGWITSRLDESTRGYPYLYRADAGYRQVWGSNPLGYFDEDGGLDYRINDLGLRGPLGSRVKGAGVYRVAFLGDSFMFGEGVREADTLSEQVARILRDAATGRTIECINGGVGGFNTEQEVALFRDLLLPYDPDAVVVLMNPGDGNSQIVNETSSWWAAHKLERLSVVFSKARSAMRRAIMPPVPQCIDDSCFNALAELREMLGPNRRLLIVMFPYLAQLHRYPLEWLHDDVASRLRADDYAVIDVYPTLRDHPVPCLTVHPDQDTHPNEIAHEVTAIAVAGHLLGDVVVGVAFGEE